MKYQVEVRKYRLLRKPLIRTFTFDDDGDFGGMLWVGKKQNINVKVTKL